MANIQSSINQMISLAGLLFSQSPEIQASAAQRAEIRRLNKKEAAVRAQIESIENIAEREPYGEQLEEIKQQQFEVDPSTKTYKAWQEVKPKRVAEVEEDPEEIAMAKYEQELKEAEVEEHLERFRKADRSVAEKQNELREIRNRILEGTPYQFDGGM